MINGQTVKYQTLEERTFVGGLQRDSTAGLSFQPRPVTLYEGIVLKFSPLLNFEGTAVDAKIDLSVNTLRSLHRTRVIAPREVGLAESTIDVPDATETRLEKTVTDWKLGQTLIISCGSTRVHDKKNGLFNLPIPGTFPTATEVLLFLDVNKVQRGRATPRRRSRVPPARTRGGRPPAAPMPSSRPARPARIPIGKPPSGPVGAGTFPRKTSRFTRRDVYNNEAGPDDENGRPCLIHPPRPARIAPGNSPAGAGFDPSHSWNPQRGSNG